MRVFARQHRCFSLVGTRWTKSSAFEVRVGELEDVVDDGVSFFSGDFVCGAEEVEVFAQAHAVVDTE
jgi:hypothetical protein